MADRLTLSNDSLTGPQGQGVAADDHQINVPLLVNDTSAHANSAVTLQAIAGPMRQNGRVVDFAIGVSKCAVSASGFVSGTVSANLRINSVSCLSTLPAILVVAGSATQAVRTATNNVSSTNGQSAVVNTASANFSAGDMIQLDFTTQSAGSAAATSAATGLYARITVRYSAQ